MVNRANQYLKAVKVEKQRTESQDIYVFYHLFLMHNWQDIFLKYLNAIKDSGLLERLKAIKICVIYNNETELEVLKDLLKDQPKTEIYYKRLFSDLPVKLWDDPKTYTETNLGEGESIMQMLAHAKAHPDDGLYVFLHAKGVTNPKNRRRRQIAWFFRKGLSKSATNEEIGRFINDKIIENTIHNWRTHVRKLQTHYFYYFVFNIFWVRSDFLQKFNFSTFNAKAEFPQFYGMTNRHWSAIFPLNLYGAVFGKKMYGLRKVVGVYI